MTLEEKIQKVKNLLKKCNENTNLAYSNFFKFLDFDNNAKKHRKLNDAIENLQNSQYDY